MTPRVETDTPVMQQYREIKARYPVAFIGSEWHEDKLRALLEPLHFADEIDRLT